MFKVVINSNNSGISINKYLDQLGVSVQRKKQLNSINSLYVNKTLVKGDFLLQVDINFPVLSL